MTIPPFPVVVTPRPAMMRVGQGYTADALEASHLFDQLLEYDAGNYALISATKAVQSLFMSFPGHATIVVLAHSHVVITYQGLQTGSTQDHLPGAHGGRGLAKTSRPATICKRLRRAERRMSPPG